MEVLFLDEHFVAVNKPCGIMVHRSKLSNDKDVLLQRVRNMVGQHVFPVHRLDRATSGVIIFALSSGSAAALNQLFTDRKIQKQYMALVRGYFPEEGILNYPVKMDNKKEDAVTEYRMLQKFELPYKMGQHDSVRYSLVELHPHTGKRHQLRQHCKHLFHPIIGDTTHGDGKHNRFLREKFKVNRMMLHSEKLMFQHPFLSETVEIEASKDDEWVQLINTFERESISSE